MPRTGSWRVPGRATARFDQLVRLLVTSHLTYNPPPLFQFFIQTVAAYDVACRIKYGQQGVRDATAASLRRVEDAGGTGGLIAVDAGGRIAMPNTSGMYRGWIDAAGLPHCAIVKDDPDDSSPFSRQ